MPATHPRALRPTSATAWLAATALAFAGVTIMTTPTEAAPASVAAPAKKGYSGAPVDPAPYTLTQPDGTTLRVRNFGDHLANGIATVKGNYTLVEGSDGYYRYAAGLTSTGELKPSDVVAGDGAAPQEAKDLSPAPIAEATQPRTPKAGTGDDKELVILAQFANRASVGSTETQWATHYFGPTGSVDDFYDEASQGQFGLAPAAESCGTADNGVTDWLTLPYNHPNTGVDNAATDDYVADAIEAADSCVDFDSFDTNTDGELTTDELHVTVIGAGYETSYGGPSVQCGPSIWGHQWSLADAGVGGPTVDGVVVGESGYTTFGEWHCRTSNDTPGHKATIGIMAHEFGHDINWPDLYDTDQSGEGVGEWSLMGSGSWGDDGGLRGNSPTYPDAYSLYYQGWITPTPATVADNIPIAAHQSLLLGPNPGGTDWLFNQTEGNGEFFLLENRTEQGYDVSTPGCGIVIYRIDETVTPSNAANANGNDPLVSVIQADGLKNLENKANRGDAGDPWPGSANKHDLSNTTTPHTKFHDATPSNLALHVDENACAATMHVDVTHLGDASPAVVRPDNDMFADAEVISGASGTVTGKSEHATVETGEPEPAGTGLASIWYRWTAPADGTVTLSLADSAYDTVLGVYTGSAVNALTEVAANDDEDFANEIYTSKVVAPVTNGTTYQIAVDGYNGDSGDVELDWSFAGVAAATVAAAHAPEPSVYGSASAVNVTVSGGSGTPTGQVTLKEGATVIGSGTLNGTGQASITLPATTPVGTHNLTVSYAGDVTYAAGTGSVTAHVITAPSTVAAVHAPEPSTYGSASSVNVTVSGGAGTPTGQVTLKEGVTVIGSATLNGTGQASVTLPASTPVGAHALTVDYAGDTHYLSSTGSVTANVGPATTTVAAVHAPEPSTFGSASSVNVTVSGLGATPTGQVTLKEGATTVGTGTLDAAGKATIALPATLPAGAHSMTVAYAGDGSHAAANGAVTATVSKASSATTATAPKKVAFKKDFDVTATVTAAGGSNTGTVEVYDGSKLIGTGTLSNGTVTIEITKNLKSGKHTLTVKYLGSANASASQTTVKVTVKKKKHKH